MLRLVLAEVVIVAVAVVVVVGVTWFNLIHVLVLRVPAEHNLLAILIQLLLLLLVVSANRLLGTQTEVYLVVLINVLHQLLIDGLHWL